MTLRKPERIRHIRNQATALLTHPNFPECACCAEDLHTILEHADAPYATVLLDLVRRRLLRHDLTVSPINRSVP